MSTFYSSYTVPQQGPAMGGEESPGQERLVGGPCGSSGPWEVVLGEWVLGDVTDYVNVSNGTNMLFDFISRETGAALGALGADLYLVSYCTGSWIDENLNGGLWAVSTEDPTQAPQYNSGNRIFVMYYASGVQTMAVFNEVKQVYNSYALALAGAAGTNTGQFFHSGSQKIQMGFVDSAVPSDNANATDPPFGAAHQTNPRFRLSRLQPWFRPTPNWVYGAAFSSTSSPRWTAYLQLDNLAPIEFGTGVTLRFRTDSVVSNSTTFAPTSVAANGQVTFSLNFDIASSAVNVCDPWLDIYYNGVVIQSFQYHFAPIIQMVNTYPFKNHTGGTPCGSVNYVEALFNNVGNIDLPSDTTGQCVITGIGGGTQILPTTCASGDTYTLGVFECQGTAISGHGAQVRGDWYWTPYVVTLPAISATITVMAEGKQFFQHVYSL